MYLLMCLLGQVKQSVPVSGLIADEASWAHLIFSILHHLSSHTFLTSFTFLDPNPSIMDRRMRSSTPYYLQ